MAFTFQPADIRTFHHKLLGVHLFLDIPHTHKRSGAAVRTTHATIHRVILQSKQHTRTITMLRQIPRWRATSAAEYRLQAIPDHETTATLHSMNKRIANQVAWTLSMSDNTNALSHLIQSFLPHAYGGLNILLPSTAFYSHRITQLTSYLLKPTMILPPPPRIKDTPPVRMDELWPTPMDHTTESSQTHIAHTPSKQRVQKSDATSPKIPSTKTPVHTRPPRMEPDEPHPLPLPHCHTHGWPSGKPGHILMAQLSRWWTGSWTEKSKPTVMPRALPPAHHTVSAILTLGLNPATYGAERNKQHVDRSTRPPIVMHPNPLYTPCPGQQIK